VVTFCPKPSHGFELTQKDTFGQKHWFIFDEMAAFKSKFKKSFLPVSSL
jgi:hypothetical protein